MEEQQAPSALATAFPSPPPFWQAFTPDNIAQITSLRTTSSSASIKTLDAAIAVPVRLLDLPAELRNLQPPAPPEDGHYRCFGDQFYLDAPLPTLEELGIEQLYTPPTTPTGSKKHSDRAFALKKMAKSLLLNFLELVGIMSVNPEQYTSKVQDLNTLFINFHHLLNEYRPHQARESLILMMQDQLERSRAETKGIREMKGKVDGILEGLGQAKLVDWEKKKEEVVEEMEEGRDVWEGMEREFGEVGA